MRAQTVMIVLAAFAVCSALAAPRVKRDDEFELNPLAVEQESDLNEVSRNKRKVTETFAAKNAILGYVFGKIDGFLDAKTRFIDTLDKQNVVKNAQHNIVAPVPIPDIQTLIQAVVSPKIQAITQTIGGLSGGLGGVFGGSSAGAGAGADGADGASPSGGASAGIGGVLSSILRLSGPILSSSSQSAAGGTSISGTATIGGADEDTPY